MKSFILIVCILFSGIGSHASAAGLNAGFVQGLWYSNEPAFANQPNRVYVALRNNAESDLTGTVRFYDNKKLIGTKNVSAVAGHIVETWTDWTPAYGEHTLTAEIEKVELHAIGEASQTATVTSALAEDVLFVDLDTDSDAIGNKEDTDDDNDTILDTVEVANGTDPLVVTKVETKATEKDVASTSKTSSNVETSTKNESTSKGNGAKGLERLTDNEPVSTALAGITETINNTKEKLDTYRESREKKLAAKTATTTIELPKSQIGLDATNVLGGGAPTSSTIITRSKAAPKANFIDTVFGIIGAIFGAAYTVVLAGLSMLLGVPAFVEFLGLLLILILIYRFARKLGRRPID